jgi:ketosteroid isomerase-like protein
MWRHFWSCWPGTSALALATGVGATGLAGCAAGHTPEAAPAPVAQVEAARREWNAALARRDTAALAELVEDSAIHLAPRFTHRGRSAFLEVFVRNMAARPAFQLTYTPERVRGCERVGCDVATEYGRWRETWLEDGEATEVSGTYYALWHRQGATWRLRSEVFATLRCRGRRYCGR